MTWRDTLDLEVLGRVTGEFEHFGGQVFQDGGTVDSGGGTDATGIGGALLEVTVNTSDGELQQANCTVPANM